VRAFEIMFVSGILMILLGAWQFVVVEAMATLKA
jgi:hypothetical protein